MKRLLTLTIAVLCLVATSFQEAKAQDYAVQPWNIMINPSISFGHVGGYYSPGYTGVSYNPSYGFTPNFMISGKLVFHEFVSAGPFFGITWNSYDSYYTGVDNDRLVATTFGAKGSFHYWNMLDKLISADFMSDKFDLYVNLYIGAEIERVTYTRPGNGPFASPYKDTDSDVDPIFHPNAGARYFPADFFGVFVEVGPGGMGYFKMGATFKFN